MQRKKYSGPKKPFDRERIERELEVKKNFGLRRKKEIWKAESILRQYRRRARDLQEKPDQAKQEALFSKLRQFGFEVSSIEDVLSLGLGDIMSRRLQTVVHKKGIANSPKHARQLITHGHIMISGRKVFHPGMIVEKSSEDAISINEKVAAKIIRSLNKQNKSEDESDESAFEESVDAVADIVDEDIVEDSDGIEKGEKK